MSSTRRANALIRMQVNATKTSKNKEENALIDSGADTTCLGPAFRIIGTTDRKVDITGCDDQMVKYDLTVGDGITLATTENGEKVLLLFNEGIVNEEGRSIIAVNQMREHGIEVNDIAKKYSGKQNIQVEEDLSIPLEYSKALTWINISYPTDDDMQNYPIIEMTSDIPWEPSDDSSEYIMKVTKKPKEPDLKRLRQCLGWKPVEVVEKTLKATTQYVKNHMRMPMRQHFKARNRALFVKRIRETVATDTFFSSHKALNGETCTQLYVGKTSPSQKCLE